MNPQMANMANMNAGGPVTGTPIMNNGQRRPAPMEPRDQLNTYIYDYFIRNNHPQLARMMIDCDLKMKLGDRNQKTSPSGRNVNGVDGMDQDSKDDLPPPELPSGQTTDNSFLLDWWSQFWDIYSASRGTPSRGSQYVAHAKNLHQMNHEQRTQRMMMAGGVNGMNGMTPQQYGMMRIPNGMAKPTDLQRAAMNNRNPAQAAAMANMTPMQKQAMMATQMQRDGSQMDMNGRPQSPGSNENVGSPNKRQRVEGGMNAANGPNQFNEFAGNVQQKSIEVYAQSLAQQQRMALNNHAISQGLNAGVQGSPMTQPGVLDGSENMFAGNPPQRAMAAGPAGQPPGNHALQDYQMQLMLLEQQNKKRLLMARQEQDNMSAPHAQGVGGPAGFSAAMSPQGSRAGGPSPNPADQIKKNTPRMGAQGLPGSPMPEGMMQPQRNSPAPNMPYDPNAPPQGFQQQYPGLPGQMPTMMRPNPSSHPGQQFNGQQMTPQQQMELMQRNGAMQNGGGWRGPPGQPGMMPNQQQMGPMGGQPQQRGQMPPPPAPANEQPRPQVPSPSQPTQAPPTPSQSNKANPKKKNTKDNKKPANKKGATGATPAASNAEEPPTPTTPMHKNFGPNGQQQQQQQPPQATNQSQPPAAQQQPQQQPPIDNNPGPIFSSNLPDEGFTDTLGLGFDDGNALETFDFESFLHVGDDANTFGMSGDYGFDAVEATGDI